MIEGLDGSGKSTVSRYLANVLNTAYKDRVKLSFEPHDPSCAGLFIRQVLTKKIKNFSSKMLPLAFAANRLDHCTRVIQPWLEGKKARILISDRYYLSSLVYQSSDHFSFAEVMELNNQARKPDLIFFLNVSDKVCYERMKVRNQPRELFEKKLDATRATYLRAIAFLRENKGDHILEIDGSGSIEEVGRQLLEEIYRYAPEWKIGTREKTAKVKLDEAVNDHSRYTLEDFIKETERDQSAVALRKKLDRLSDEQLISLFFSYFESQGYEVGNKVANPQAEVIEMTYQATMGITFRGSALLLKEGQTADEILKIAVELGEMSDFMLAIFVPGAALAPPHFEREKISYLNGKEALFPALRIFTRNDLAQGISAWMKKIN